MFLGQLMQKCSGWIGGSSSKYSDIKNESRVYVYCSVHPRPVTVNLDSDFTNGDPRRLRRPQNAKRSDGPHESPALVDVGGSGTLSASRCTQCQIA